MLIVQNITNDSTFSRGTAKIFAINGSVATGKLLVVKNIIQEIFLRSNGLKILFCATSTTIVHRLTDGLDLFLRRSHQKFDLLQIGNKSSHIAASIDKRLKSMSQEPKHADKSSGEKRSFLLKQVSSN